MANLAESVSADGRYLDIDYVRGEVVGIVLIFQSHVDHGSFDGGLRT
jgi:hypothetical protein